MTGRTFDRHIVGVTQAKETMKMRSLLIPIVLAAFGVACTAQAEPLPQSNTEATTATTSKAVSSCDAVREALLTGTQEQINAAMQQLKADQTADATAREYADYYLIDAARGATEAMQTSVMVIRMSCSI